MPLLTCCAVLSMRPARATSACLYLPHRTPKTRVQGALFVASRLRALVRCPEGVFVFVGRDGSAGAV